MTAGMGERVRRVVRGALGAWVLTAGLLGCSANDLTQPVTLPPELPADTTLHPGDLVVGFIQRQPELDYIRGSTDPTREGWPAPGQQVSWVAHIHNYAQHPFENVPYVWTLDGASLGSGSFDVLASGDAAVTLTRPWSFVRHCLSFSFNGGDRTQGGDSLTVFTDALSVGFWVEQGFYDFMRKAQLSAPFGWYGFEHWAQAHIDRFNQMAAQAIYPGTPAVQGVLDRLRLDRITLVPNGTLPLRADGAAMGAPAPADHTVDLQWGFPASSADSYVDFTAYGPIQGYWGPLEYNGSTLHELGHVRYLIDVYQTTVYDGVHNNSVDILENGVRVAGSHLMPGPTVISTDGTGIVVYRSKYQGLMNSDYTYIDAYSAVALNLIAGHRATYGNTLTPDNLGEFVLRDLPAHNRLVITDLAGQPITGARVQIYQLDPSGPGLYSKHFDNIPDIDLTTDDQGAVLLPRNPFSPGEDSAGGRLVAIVRVERDHRVAYTFWELFDLNMEYWRGHTDLGEYTLAVDLQNP